MRMRRQSGPDAIVPRRGTRGTVSTLDDDLPPSEAQGKINRKDLK